ncbi:hypothetical protein [Ornithinimicrobium sediminis]|uniref:hypothetical protein n=1 Tax=Ornithinimicrobium sediminis TaxID=2904603 RepID=UPI001E640FEE|nr:hypothetical protein [Ornithinimicrobium sediminis]MCE0488128.1 hypothetical protein [Ornithinimicrobium sediminis]
MELHDDLDFAVWFAAAAEAGWEPSDDEGRRVDKAWAGLVPGAQTRSEVIAMLAQSASAMHDAILTLAFSDDGRFDSSGAAEGTLVRTAIESLATGLWLMLPEVELQKRRYVSLMVDDLDDMLQMGATLTGERHGRAARKEFPAQSFLVTTSTTQIIRSIDEAFGTSYLADWRLYSGLAHGRPWARSALHDSVLAADPTKSEHLSRVLGMLNGPVGLARRYLEVADLRRRFEGRTTLELARLDRVRQFDA